MKVFLDTNVLASALTTRGLCAELFEVVLQSHELLTSDPVLRELERILPEKLGQSEEVTEEFINLLHTHALLVNTAPPSLHYQILMMNLLSLPRLQETRTFSSLVTSHFSNCKASSIYLSFLREFSGRC